MSYKAFLKKLQILSASKASYTLGYVMLGCITLLDVWPPVQ